MGSWEFLFKSRILGKSRCLIMSLTLWQVAGLSVAASQLVWDLRLAGLARLRGVEFGIAISTDDLARSDA